MCCMLGVLIALYFVMPVCMSVKGEHVCRLCLLCNPCLLTKIGKWHSIGNLL